MHLLKWECPYFLGMRIPKSCLSPYIIDCLSFIYLTFFKMPFLGMQVSIWSAGVIFYQMIFGRCPFGHEQTQEQILREDNYKSLQGWIPYKAYYLKWGEGEFDLSLAVFTAYFLWSYSHNNNGWWFLFVHLMDYMIWYVNVWPI